MRSFSLSAIAVLALTQSDLAGYDAVPSPFFTDAS